MTAKTNTSTRANGSRAARVLADGRVVARDEARHETEGSGEARADTYIAVSASTMATRTGYWVDCPLPAYAGLRVLYRTNNQTKRRRERPTLNEPYELRQQRRALATLNERLDALAARLGPATEGEQQEDQDALAEQLAEVEAERDALVQSIIAAAQQYADSFRAEECRWLSLFVIGFEGWPFEDIPEPDPDDPDSYVPLWQGLEDLYFWLLDRGYQKALAEATKNY